MTKLPILFFFYIKYIKYNINIENTTPTKIKYKRFTMKYLIEFIDFFKYIYQNIYLLCIL